MNFIGVEGELVSVNGHDDTMNVDVGLVTGAQHIHIYGETGDWWGAADGTRQCVRTITLEMEPIRMMHRCHCIQYTPAKSLI